MNRPTTVKACRWISSACIAIAVSGVVVLASGIAYDALDLQRKTGIDDDICWLTVLFGPVCMIIFHRRFHATRWLPPATSWVGGIGLAGAAVVLAKVVKEADAHVPTGPYSSLGYAIMMAFSIIVGAACLLAMIGGLLGVVANRMDKKAI